MSGLKDFELKFKVNDLLVFDSKYWNVSVRPVQVTIGSLVVSLKRSETALSLLSVEELSDLKDVYEFIESRLTAAFSPSKFNYLTLMMLDEHVHFHVIPRYKDGVAFNGDQYEDSDWPKPADIFQSIDVDVFKIKDYLLKK